MVEVGYPFIVKWSNAPGVTVIEAVAEVNDPEPEEAVKLTEPTAVFMK